jgi:hypothetical protein
VTQFEQLIENGKLNHHEDSIMVGVGMGSGAFPSCFALCSVESNYVPTFKFLDLSLSLLFSCQMHLYLLCALGKPLPPQQGARVP